MSVFAELVGQDEAVATLAAAARAAADLVAGGSGAGMTHAWLFTGPPGSGRSVAARAFAAALQCTSSPAEGGPGCGHCTGCHTALRGTHSDVAVVVPEGLSIGVRDTRALVLEAAGRPAEGRFRVVVIEDADRLMRPGTERAANALLKAIEEPAARTVFLLCAPSVEDVLPTVLSRCRLVTLRTPPPEAISALLMERDGVDPALAAYAASASQGHIGRARRLATDETARRERRESLGLATRLGSVPAALAAARDLVEAAKEAAATVTAARDDAETAALKQALGAGLVKGSGRASTTVVRGSAGALTELEKRQKSRATRAQRDALDRALVDLAAYYRDVLVRQLGAAVRPVHGDLAQSQTDLARRSTPPATLHRLEAVMACRSAIEANVAPQLAVEQMALRLLRA